jgi:hypothetical protein
VSMTPLVSVSLEKSVPSVAPFQKRNAGKRASEAHSAAHDEPPSQVQFNYLAKKRNLLREAVPLLLDSVVRVKDSGAHCYA